MFHVDIQLGGDGEKVRDEPEKVRLIQQLEMGVASFKQLLMQLAHQRVVAYQNSKINLLLMEMVR